MKKAIFYHHILEAAEQTGRSVEEILAEAKKAGFDGVECDVRQFEKAPDEFMALLEKTGLVISSVCKYFDFGHKTDREEIEAYLDLLVKVKVKKTLIIPGFFDENSDREKETARIVEALKLVCELAEKRGITVTLEDYDDAPSPCSTMGGLKHFMDEVPGLKFTLDTGNFRYSCEDVLEAYDLLGDRLGHVHLKDRSELPMTEGDGGPKALDGKTLYPAPVGSGYIPIEECIRRTREDGYDDWYTAEHFGSVDMLGYIRQSARFLAAF